MRLLVAADFVSDADSIAVQMLAGLGYKHKARDTSLTRFALLFTHAERTIPPARYEVRLSTEIRKSPKLQTHRKAFDEIVSRLQRAETLQPYLSTRAVRADFQDGLLLTWGVHHLHLNTVDTAGKRGFVARKWGQAELLLLRIKGQTAYLIDIVSHDEPDLFHNPRLLEIVDRNWPELHYELKAVTGEEFGPEKVKALRSNATNFAIKINGRTVMPKLGITATGIPIEVYGWHRAFHAELRNAEMDARRRLYEFFPNTASPSRCTPAIEHVKLIGIEPEFFIFQHQGTQEISYGRRAHSLQR